MRFAPEEIADRRHVWVAMSDLFLDTDVRLNYCAVAEAAARSAFSLEQLAQIYLHEVAPALLPNLLAVAGEWAGFDEEWVVQQISHQSSLTATTNRAVGRLLLGKAVQEEWSAVAVLIRVLRGLPAAEWPNRLQLWRVLLPLFMEADPANRRQLPAALREIPCSAEEREAVMRCELMPAFGGSPENQRPIADVAADWDELQKSL